MRFGTLADAPQIAALHVDSWVSAYAGILPDDYLAGPLLQERLELWDARLTYAADDACLLIEGAHEGFAYLVPQHDGRVLLDNLHVRPGLKRSGIGRSLMREAFAWTAAHHPGAPLYLEVLRDNAPAIAFYERLGGQITREFDETFPAGFVMPVIEYTWTPDRFSPC